MSSRNLSSRGGAGVVVLDEYLIPVHREHLHNERTMGLADMVIYNRTDNETCGENCEKSNGK